MNRASLSETIQFLQFIHRGNDPEIVVQEILERKNQEIDEQFQKAIASILSLQAAIEMQIEELIQQMGAKDWLQPTKNQSTATQKRIDELATVQIGLQNTLIQTQRNLQLHRKNIQVLNQGLPRLNNELPQVPSRYEAPLVELGQKACNFLAQS